MRQNNFDIVRLTLASIVVLVHAYDLSNGQSLAVLTRFVSSRVAVEGFFAISGFLIFASYERCNSLREYFSNRAWRILPGYWLSTVFCLLIAFSFGSFHVGKFLLANLTFANFLQPGVPGVFAGNPANDALNGALWTIKIEVMFYVAVPLIVWLCRRLQRDAVLLGLFVASILFRIVFANHDKIAIQLPGQLSYFLVGALIYYHLPSFKRQGHWIMTAALALYALHAWTGLFLFRPAAIATLTLGACLLLPQIKGPTRWGDFSYGTYLYAFPLEQLIVQAFGHPVRAGVLFLCATPAALMAAVCSWYGVERHFLPPARKKETARHALESELIAASCSAKP